VAQFDAAELITQREVVGHFLSLPLQMTNYFSQVSSRIREDLLARAGEFNLKLGDVSIVHSTFGKACFHL
jgi:prohibitin 1